MFAVIPIHVQCLIESIKILDKLNITLRYIILVILNIQNKKKGQGSILMKLNFKVTVKNRTYL